MRRFEGRRVFVTGGSKGIGAAVARRLAAEGADVVLAARGLEDAQSVADEIGGTAVALDVGDADAVAAAVGTHGPFDVLVSNAGIDDSFGRFTHTTPDGWPRLIAVNLEGALACAHAVLPSMQAAGYGRIVMITSEAGRMGSKGNAVYAATKGALISLAKSLARENARYGITVNAVAPGPIETPMLDAHRTATRGDDVLAAMVAGTQLGRLGTPEEVASAVAFLAAEEASYVTGETLGVSGGMGLGG
jgi:2-hydroxycyclohexanecarboxyl-CoA dehydrogenase